MSPASAAQTATDAETTREDVTVDADTEKARQ